VIRTNLSSNDKKHIKTINNILMLNEDQGVSRLGNLHQKNNTWLNVSQGDRSHFVERNPLYQPLWCLIYCPQYHFTNLNPAVPHDRPIQIGSRFVKRKAINALPSESPEGPPDGLLKHSWLSNTHCPE